MKGIYDVTYKFTTKSKFTMKNDKEEANKVIRLAEVKGGRNLP